MGMRRGFKTIYWGLLRQQAVWAVSFLMIHPAKYILSHRYFLTYISDFIVAMQCWTMHMYSLEINEKYNSLFLK